MTRTYSRQYTPGDSWSYDIVSRVYDKGSLSAMFNATFDKDYKLVYLNIVNVSLPNPIIGTELQTFLVRAYKVCSGMDTGLLEFQFSDNL